MLPFLRVSCPECGNELIVPKKVDKLLLEEKLSEDQFSLVYRATDILLDREVAVKSMNPVYGHHIVEELTSITTVSHQYIIPIYTLGTMDDCPYITMQLMKQGNLETWLDTQKELSVQSACKALLQIAYALHTAEQEGLLHHSLKPSNILFDSDGMIKVSDFEFCRGQYSQKLIMGDDQFIQRSLLTMDIAYMSPERLHTGIEDNRGTIYSLGACFYFMLTGSRPFAIDDPDRLLKYRLANTTELSPILKDMTVWEAKVNTLLQDMMAPLPEDRIVSFEQLIKRLEDFHGRTTNAKIYVKRSKRKKIRITKRRVS